MLRVTETPRKQGHTGSPGIREVICNEGKFFYVFLVEKYKTTLPEQSGFVMILKNLYAFFLISAKIASFSCTPRIALPEGSAFP